MDKKIRRFINLISDQDLRERVAEIVQRPQIDIGGTTYAGLPLEVSPAGLSRHHSYEGGLIEHVAALGEIALTLCNIVEKIYGGKVNRDLVLAGVLLHDIFKPLTFGIEDGHYLTSPLGDRLDHLTLISGELMRKGFPLDMVHIVCAHHGGQAGGIWPRTVEALVCHLADLADSQLNGQILRAARYLSRRAVGGEPELMGSRDAFDIVHSKSVGGWEGVRKTVKRIRDEKSLSQ